MLETGQWRSFAYRLFLDLGLEEATARAPIPIEASDDEGAGGQGSPEEGIPGPWAFGIRGI